MKAGLVALVSFFSFSIASNRTITESFDAKKIRRLEVRNSSGRIMITGQDSPVAKVVAHKKEFSESCQLTVEMQRDTLVVAIDHKEHGFFEGSECEVDFAIEVPRNLRQEISNGAGAVVVSATRGPITITNGAGEVDLSEVDVDGLEARSGAGDVKVRGVVRSGEIRVGAGDVEVSLEQTPKRGELDIDSGTGNAVVWVPASAKIKTDLATATGTHSSEVADAHIVDYHISMRSGTGDLRVRKL